MKFKKLKICAAHSQQCHAVIDCHQVESIREIKGPDARTAINFYSGVTMIVPKGIEEVFTFIKS
jgi:hypothetical protein